jgi:hypothetical protein
MLIFGDYLKYVEYCLLGYDIMSSGRSLPMFRRNALVPSSGLKSKPSRNHEEAGGKQRSTIRSVGRLILAGFLLGLLFDTEDGGSTFLRNMGGLLPDYTALPPRR